MSVFMPLPYCSDFYSLVICLEIRKLGSVISPALFLLRLILVVWGLLWLHMTFRVFFSFYFCEKCDLDFDRNCIDSVVHTSVLQSASPKGSFSWQAQHCHLRKSALIPPYQFTYSASCQNFIGIVLNLYTNMGGEFKLLLCWISN